MSPLVDPGMPAAPPVADLAAAIQQILQASPQPLTLSKIRVALPAAHRSISQEDLAEALRRLVAANVLVQYPRYRSQQDRFWDRPMEVHVVTLIEAALVDGALPWSELRRKLPVYAQMQAETVLEEQVRHGRIHCHPRVGRTGERYGLKPAHPRDYLREELQQMIQRLVRLGFQPAQIREAAIELLHEEEWASPSEPQHEPTEHPHPQQPERTQSTETVAATTEQRRSAEADPSASTTPEHMPHAEQQPGEPSRIHGQ